MSPFMARALELADSGRGRTSPNPAVGAVLVRDHEIVGEGFTRPPGGPHAEIVALEQAGARARGAALWVTLEPCCHHGRTPPCVAAIVAAGVAEVHAATLDPFPAVAGRGISALRMAGISVSVGEGEAEARRLNEGFLTYHELGRPFVAIKWAMTLDGRIATAARESRWITGPAARERVHELRDTADAIVVGAGTATADDPQLTVRMAALHRPPRRTPPLRVVVDSRGRVPLGSRLFREPLARGTVVAATAEMPVVHLAELESRGAKVLVLPSDASGRVDLDALVSALGRMDVRTILVEGGGELAGSLLDRRLVDRVYAFVAPLMVGGNDAPGPVGGRGVTALRDALRLEEMTVEQIGPDLLLTGSVPAHVRCAASPAAVLLEV